MGAGPRRGLLAGGGLLEECGRGTVGAGNLGSQNAVERRRLVERIVLELLSNALSY